MSDPQDELLEYYRRELGYLRSQGAEFALRYPKVARHLALSPQESRDPHVERLIEAVAFLGARVHRDLDREFPIVAQHLLDSLCPNLSQSVPSMTVVQMALNPSQGKVTSGLQVTRGTMLQTVSPSGVTVRFQVAWDTTLWPLRIDDARLLDSRTVGLRIGGLPGTDLSELEIDELRIHLSGELLSTMPIHDLLLASLQDVQIESSDGLVSLGPSALRECGFEPEHAVVPQPEHAHPSYSLLQEYFSFPRKFQFFDLCGLKGRLGQGEYFTIRLVFDRNSAKLGAVNLATFQVGCVPAINLFSLTSEPIELDRRQSEYKLVGDRQREDHIEIHAVESVTLSDPDSDRPERVPPAFGAIDSGELDDEPPLRWVIRQELTLRPELSGTDTWLSFVDRAQVRQVPTQPVVYADLLCTNRQLAQQVPPGARLVGAGLSESLMIKVLYEPSAPRLPALGAKRLTSLLAILRLNHRSLVDADTSAQRLHEVLSLFAGETTLEQAQIRGLRNLQARPALARTGQDTWRGFCRGTELRIEFDEAAYAGSSPLLLAAVLARFFAMYTTVNSFVQIRVDRGGQAWKVWPAMTGYQCLT